MCYAPYLHSYYTAVYYELFHCGFTKVTSLSDFYILKTMRQLFISASQENCLSWNYVMPLVGGVSVPFIDEDMKGLLLVLADISQFASSELSVCRGVNFTL